MSNSVVVLGGGSWGTTLASIAAAHRSTVLWVRSPELEQEINDSHRNERYLPGIELSKDLRATSSLEEALSNAGAVLVGVPSHGLRDVLETGAPFIAEQTPVFSLSKGIEATSSKRMSEVIQEVIPQALPGVVTGPNLAREIAVGQPAASVVACENEAAALQVQAALHSPTFRSYVSTDVIGCEVAGATKNVLAIAVGISDGFGFGENTRAMLIARGLAEMGRLGVALGGHTLTFGGLAGVGDLVATATSDHSRNRTVGVQLGQGRELNDIMNSMHMVAEGVKTAVPLQRLAEQAGVEIPICAQIAGIITGAITPREAIASLTDRPARGEFDELLEVRRNRS